MKRIDECWIFKLMSIGSSHLPISLALHVQMQDIHTVPEPHPIIILV